MNVFERFLVACFRAVDVFFSTLSPPPHVDVEERLRYSDLGGDYEEPDSLDLP